MLCVCLQHADAVRPEHGRAVQSACATLGPIDHVIQVDLSRRSDVLLQGIRQNESGERVGYNTMVYSESEVSSG